MKSYVDVSPVIDNLDQYVCVYRWAYGSRSGQCTLRCLRRIHTKNNVPMPGEAASAAERFHVVQPDLMRGVGVR